MICYKRPRSFHQFMDRCDHIYAIRMSANTLAIEKAVTPGAKKSFLLANLPYYPSVKLPEYITWFRANHRL